MHFELMLPYQIKESITKNIPVVLPIGVMEYHGEHMAVGMDKLAVTSSSVFKPLALIPELNV